MEGMSSILGTVGKFAAPIMGGFGMYENLMKARQQENYIKQQLAMQQQAQAMEMAMARAQMGSMGAMLDQEKKGLALANNPAELARRARALEAPLSQGLQADVGNEVQAGLAERGLATSPSIATQILAQALAPYQQQNQNTALQAVMQSLGILAPGFPTGGGGGIGSIGSGAGSALLNQQPSDTSSFWKMFLPSGAPPVTSSAEPGLTGGGTFDMSGIMDPMAVMGPNFGSMPPEMAFGAGF